MAKTNTSKVSDVSTIGRKYEPLTQCDIEYEKHLAAHSLATIKALAEAVEVLTALERAPIHQDTHPSHDIKTGGGYASNHKLSSETLPKLLSHIGELATDLDDCLDGFFERLEGSNEVCHG